MKNRTKFINVKPETRKNIWTLVIVIEFFTVVSIGVNIGVLGSLFEGLLIPICYYIILAVSLNLTVGILGELSLGHAGFMCVGAYASGIFSILMKEAIPQAVIRYLLALIVGGLAAGLIGLLIGIPILRLRGDYLAIVTLAFGEIIYKIIQNCYLVQDVNGLHFSFSAPVDASKLDLDSKKNILNGAMSVQGIPKDATLVISIILVIITLIVVFNVVDSRSGRAAKSIRDNRIAAESIGINITKYKLIIFFASAFFAGIAGTMFSHFSTLDPSKFNYNLSISILVFVVLGGLGNMRGSIIATIILYALPELLRSFQAYRMLLYAIILIIMMIANNNEKISNMKNNLFAKLGFKKPASREEI